MCSSREAKVGECVPPYTLDAHAGSEYVNNNTMS